MKWHINPKMELLFPSICFFLLIITSVNSFTQITGWFEPAEIVTPETGSISDGVISAVGAYAVSDNARLNAMIVYDYYSNTTFATYLGGADQSSAGIYVISFNHTTQTQTQPRGVYIFQDEGTTWDTHSYPTIVKSLDGHIHVFFADMLEYHKTLHVRFDERGTVESTYTLSEVPHGRTFYGRSSDSFIRSTYPAPFVSRNGSMYYFAHYNPYNSYEMEVFYRGETYSAGCRPEIYVRSDDNGLTWNPIKIGLFRENYYDFLTEPYVTQIVPEPQREGVEERIRITWTMAAGIALWYDASGTLQHDYHNAYSKNTYHAYFVPGEDNFYSVSGINLGESILHSEMENYCMVTQTLDANYSLPMTYSQYEHITDRETSIMGNFSVVNNTGDVVVNFYRYWNGTEWETITPEIPADTRIMDWKNGRYYAYNGFNNYYTTSLDAPLNTMGSLQTELENSVVASRVNDIGMKRSCPPARHSHPEAHVWVKADASGEQFGGFVLLAGHHTSYTPYKIVIEAEQGTVYPGQTVNLNAYIADENGARILTADNTINFSSEIGSFSNVSIDANQGLGKSVLTINGDVTPGEYMIEASSNGLAAGFVYVTIKVADSEKPSTPGSLTATAISHTQVQLNWSASSDNMGVINYHIYRNGEDLTSVSGTSFTDTYLTAQTTYTYTVTANDANGNESDQSNEASVTTLAPSLVNNNVHNTIVSVVNYPNPFNSETQIDICLDTPCNISIAIYDVYGRKVDELSENTFFDKRSTIRYMPKNISAGVYYLMLNTGDEMVSTRILYLGE